MKINSADQRESPAEPLARRLRAAGAHVGYFDPLIEKWSIDGDPVPRSDRLEDALTSADLAILLQPHRCVDLTALVTGTTTILDTRGVLPACEAVERL